MRGAGGRGLEPLPLRQGLRVYGRAGQTTRHTMVNTDATAGPSPVTDAPLAGEVTEVNTDVAANVQLLAR